MHTTQILEKMSGLSAFCNTLVEFFEELAETYPEEKDIRMAWQALKLMKQANPRMIHNFFMEHVYQEFAERILNEDEEYILKRAHDILNSQYAEINYAFWIFDKHWSTMTETNKQHVWAYLKAIILLAQKV
jgi:hypothetical protein